MAARDFRMSMEPVLRPLLAEGERLLAASPLVADPGTTEDVSLADELVNLLDPTLLIGLGAHPGNLLQQATFGKGVVGGPDSLAGKLFAAVEKATGPTLAVTDTGLAVFDVGIKSRGDGWFQRMFGAVDRVATLVHRVPRTNILGAVPAPKGVLRKGRLLAGFTDGSGCALVCAPPSLAAEVAAAIGAPQNG